MSLIHGMYPRPARRCYGSDGNGEGNGCGYVVGTSGFGIGQGDGNGAGNGYRVYIGHPFNKIRRFRNGRDNRNHDQFYYGRSNSSPDLEKLNPIGVFLLREGFHTYPSGLV